MQYTAAERVAFFDDMISAYERVEAAAGRHERHLTLAGRHIHLKSAGKAPLDKIYPAFEHLTAASGDSPALTVHIWDNASSQTLLPLPIQSLVNAIPYAAPIILDPRQEMRDFNDDRMRAMFRLGPCHIMSLYDRQRNLAVYWIDDCRKIPYWETASPLQILLNWWAEEQGLQYLHAAAVGTSQGALVLTGKGGSGKSSTALACLRSGMGYLADDYCLAGEGHVHSLYSTAKLVGQNDLERFPELVEWVENPEREAFHKICLNVYRHRPAQMILGAPLKAVVVPRVPAQPQETSQLRRVRGSEALLALAPTTLFQLAGTHQASLTRMSSLIRSLPAYVLELGRDVDRLAGLLSALLEQDI